MRSFFNRQSALGNPARRVSAAVRFSAPLFAYQAARGKQEPVFAFMLDGFEETESFRLSFHFFALALIASRWAPILKVRKRKPSLLKSLVFCSSFPSQGAPPLPPPLLQVSHRFTRDALTEFKSVAGQAVQRSPVIFPPPSFFFFQADCVSERPISWIVIARVASSMPHFPPRLLPFSGSESFPNSRSAKIDFDLISIARSCGIYVPPPPPLSFCRPYARLSSPQNILQKS